MQPQLKDPGFKSPVTVGYAVSNLVHRVHCAPEPSDTETGSLLPSSLTISYPHTTTQQQQADDPSTSVCQPHSERSPVCPLTLSSPLYRESFPVTQLRNTSPRLPKLFWKSVPLSGSLHHMTSNHCSKTTALLGLE